jgi:hypothetical protein
MKFILFLQYALFTLCIFLFQQSVSGQTFRTFDPLLAGMYEQRVGSFYQTNVKKLRLDIGATTDLFHYQQDSLTNFSFGTDFFTYTRLRSEENFKFPVETSDYFFGGNISYAKKIDSQYSLFGRLRIAHISSHLVDGYSDNGVFRETPFVYSREFFDFLMAVTTDNGIRAYAGFTGVWHSQPRDASRFIPQFGVEYTYDVTDWFAFVAGLDARVVSSTPSFSVQAGLRFLNKDKKGILLSWYNYDGRSMHGMFYKQKDAYGGIGFQILF